MSLEDYDFITGTMVAYYIYCPRRCWLFAHHIQMEQNSDYVRIGKFYQDEIHKRNESRKDLEIGNFKIDEIKNECVIELKKSKSNIESAKYQLLYYLYHLEKLNVYKIGILKFKENTGEQKVILTDERRKEIEKLLKDIRKLISYPNPPKQKFGRKCYKCSYRNFCFA